MTSGGSVLRGDRHRRRLHSSASAAAGTGVADSIVIVFAGVGGVATVARVIVFAGVGVGRDGGRIGEWRR